MKKLLLISLFLVAVGTNEIQAQNKTITFEKGSWSEIMEKSKKSGKPIFVDAFAVWCGPCKWMTKNVFANDTVADYYNSNFINVKIDMEAGEGIELAEKWKITAFPTLLYFSSEGELLLRSCGALGVSQFIDFGKDAQKPEKQFFTRKQKYEAGNRDPEFVSNYIYQLKESCMDFAFERDAYFKTQKDEELTNQQNWDLIKASITDVDSREFRYLESNQSKFDQLYSNKSVSETMGYVYNSTLFDAIYNDTTGAEYLKVRNKILARQIPASSKALDITELNYYRMIKDWEGFATAAENYTSKYSVDDAWMLNSLAWKFFEKFTDQKRLMLAVGWAEKSVELDETPENLDTYANLLFVTGKKSEAIKMEKRAIEIAVKEGNFFENDLKKTLKEFQSK